MFCLGRFQRAGRPAPFWWRPAFFKKLKWRPAFFWWRPMTPCYNFYFATNVTVRGNWRGNYACVSLFYSTAFVIVIRLVYKNLCYWPIRIYFGMLATDCCITFIQWKVRTQELLSLVRDVRYFDFWFSPVFQRLIYVRLHLCYCYSALCLTLIQTLVVTGKDDNVSGFSECEIRDVCVSSVICVFTDWRKRTRRTLSIRLIA